jgi:hypothetical protein
VLERTKKISPSSRYPLTLRTRAGGGSAERGVLLPRDGPVAAEGTHADRGVRIRRHRGG